MKQTLIKTAAFLLSLLMLLSVLTACGSKQDAATDAAIDAAVQAAIDAAAAPTAVTIVDTDGRHITIEDADGKSLQQLLDMANITLDKQDFLTVDSDQILSGSITVRVLRNCTVTVVIAAEDPLNDIRHTVMLTGGTVADAIAAAQIELGNNYSVNYALHETLADGMEIVISTESTPVSEETPTDPEETEPEDTEPEDTGSSGNDSGYTPQPTEPAPTQPAPTEPAPTEPAPTEPERTVVSVEVYEDCDGSGHGVKVITYSDGTQEEVYF